jgi:AraC-like DNA-binding protein
MATAVRGHGPLPRECQAGPAAERREAEPEEQVARALGYTDPACFTRAFRRRTGEAPSAVRAGMGGSRDRRTVANEPTKSRNSCTTSPGTARLAE